MRRCTESPIDSLVSILYGWTSVSICEVVDEPSRTTNAYLAIQQVQFPLCVDESSPRPTLGPNLNICSSRSLSVSQCHRSDSSRHGMDNVVFFKMVWAWVQIEPNSGPTETSSSHALEWQMQANISLPYMPSVL